MANTSALSENLDKLIRKLDEYTGTISLQDLKAIMESSPLSMADIEQFVHFKDSGYARNVIKRTPYYEMLCLCWQPGQRSPIHDHKDCNCCVKVMEGIATCTDFQRVPSGYIKATHSEDMLTSSLCAVQDLDIHQVSNLQGENRNLVTIHIYTPPQDNINVYNLINNQISKAVFVDFTDAKL